VIYFTTEIVSILKISSWGIQIQVEGPSQQTDYGKEGVSSMKGEMQKKSPKSQREWLEARVLTMTGGGVILWWDLFMQKERATIAIFLWQNSNGVCTPSSAAP